MQKVNQEMLVAESLSKTLEILQNLKQRVSKYLSFDKNTILNIGRYTGISTEISVFYSKRYDKCIILRDIVLDRYGPIYQPISEMKISDISPNDAFADLLQIHLRSFYKK